VSRNDAATPHSTCTTLVMAAQRRAIRTTPRPDSQVASGGRPGGDSLFDPGTRNVLGHLMLRSGEQVRCHGPRGSLERRGDLLKGSGPSTEAETRSRGWNPRARRRLARGAGALKRGGDLVKGRHALE
jgi:hypothetical protein